MANSHERESMATRILLADDQVMFVENLGVVLETNASDFTVVGIANDGRAAVRKARDLQPDLILMDVRMPGLDGVGATRQIIAEMPRTRIIMLTIFDDDDYVHQALAYGASGYLLKNMRPDALVSSIRAVLDGAVLISPLAAQRLVSRSAGVEESGASEGEGGEAHEQPDWVDELSTRERKVFALMIEDLSNAEIAERLSISETTVRNYISSIYHKTGAANRFEATRLARTYRSFLPASE